MNWRRAAVAASFMLPLILVLALGFNHDPHAIPSMLEHRPAPAFTLAQQDGTQLALTNLRGKPVVLNFWATWCYPCQAEHQMLQQAARYYGERAKFVGIVYEDSSAQADKYLKDHGSTYVQLLDPDAKVAIDYGVAGVPESFIIDADGIIVHKEAGVLTPEVLQAHLGPLLKDAT